ncbi:MAG: HEAT repeat domain-containing protein [Planctomycetota bacterium]
MPLGEDLTSWRLWWDFNHDAHLPLVVAEAAQPKTGADEFFLGATRAKEVQSMRPSRAVMVQDVLPALRQAIVSGPAEVTAAALLAMARAGLDHPDFSRVEEISKRLGDGDQSVRECAALALGLTGDSEAFALLSSTLRGKATPMHRKGAEISTRTRAFAAYGLGTLAREAGTTKQKAFVFDELDRVLKDDAVDREVRVAALQAVSLLDLEGRGGGGYQGARLLDRVLARLDGMLTLASSRAERDVQSQVPVAIARLLGPGHRRTPRYRKRFAAILSGRRADGRRLSKVPHEVSQSCALAIGQMLGSGRGDADVVVGRADIQKVLLDVWRSHKDAQTRNFAMLALGKLGGEENRRALLRTFRRASSAVERPWCALALGLLAGEHRLRTGETDRYVVDRLEESFAKTKNPEAAGAMAVALGLAHADGARNVLMERLRRGASKPQLAAAVSDALSMLGDAGGCDSLRKLLSDCDRQPELYGHVGAALGRLGDAEIANELAVRLSAGEANRAMQVAIANALADVGDRRQVGRLVRVAGDRSRSAITRVGAVRALSGILRRGSARWNTPLRANINYRSVVASLTDRNAGVLDLR